MSSHLCMTSPLSGSARHFTPVSKAMTKTQNTQCERTKYLPENCFEEN